MSQATKAVAGSEQVINGVTYFITSANKAMALFPRIPRSQYSQVLALAQSKDLKAQLEAKSPERVIAFRYDLQRMLAAEVKVTCFEQIKAAKQAGAAFLYRKALKALVKLASDVLTASACDEATEALLGEPNVTGEDLANHDMDAALSEFMAEGGREY